MPRRGCSAGAPAKDPPAKEAPPAKEGNKRVRPSEAETAAADAAAEAADIEDSTEPQASQNLPQALLERRLSRSKDKVSQLER